MHNAAISLKAILDRTAGRLALAFFIMVLVTAGVSLVGYRSAHTINNALDDIFTLRMPSIDYLMETDRDLQQLLVAERSMIFANPGTEVFEQLAADYKQKLKQSAEWIDKYRKLADTDEEHSLLASYDAARKEWLDLSTQIVDGRKADTRAGRRLALDLTLGQAREAFEKMRNNIDKLEEISLREASDTERRAEETYKHTIFMLLASAIAALLVASVLAFIVTRSVTRPLGGEPKDMADIALRIADGDLSYEFKNNNNEASLYYALTRMATRLNEVVGNVKDSAKHVAGGSSQISSTGQEISSGATEQAASLEQVSSSMEEMAANIRQSSDNASQTEQIASKAAADADESGQAVSDAVNAMKDIAEKISVIEEIARQTNLLALNAAIEAARAGEHGKGFAVVASEVRKLAEHSQKAAGEISERSGYTVEVAERAGERLLKLVPDIRRTAELVQEISVTAREQDSAAEEINRALLQLDNVVQQAAANAEEMAATSEELSAQAESLNESVAYFTLKNDVRKSA